MDEAASRTRAEWHALSSEALRLQCNSLHITSSVSQQTLPGRIYAFFNPSNGILIDDDNLPSPPSTRRKTQISPPPLQPSTRRKTDVFTPPPSHVSPSLNQSNAFDNGTRHNIQRSQDSANGSAEDGEYHQDLASIIRTELRRFLTPSGAESAVNQFQNSSGRLNRNSAGLSSPSSTPSLEDSIMPAATHACHRRTNQTSAMNEMPSLPQSVIDKI